MLKLRKDVFGDVWAIWLFDCLPSEGASLPTDLDPVLRMYLAFQDFIRNQTYNLASRARFFRTSEAIRSVQVSSAIGMALLSQLIDQ